MTPSSAPTYRHTQIGKLLLLVSLAVVPLALLPPWLAGRTEFSLVGLGLLGLVVLLFYGLTVQIDATTLSIAFGIGLIRKRWPLADIQSCTPVRNSWIYGWGIRLTPHGWLYNVSGLDAVDIRLKNGKTCRIGTDEPEALSRALQAAFSSRD